MVYMLLTALKYKIQKLKMLKYLLKMLRIPPLRSPQKMICYSALASVPKEMKTQERQIVKR